MSEYVGPILWSVLPGQVAHAVLPTLSGTLPRLFPPAARGTPAYASNFRRVFTVLVLGWLVYAFATDSAKDDAGGDWYALLSVTPGAGDDELKRAFRALSRQYHPDALGANAPAWAEERFIAIRAAYEALSDPVRRFAYDRFGPDIVSWGGGGGGAGTMKTTRAYIVAGAQRAAGMYVATIALLALLYVLGRARQGTYWRLVLVGALAVIEASLVLAPTPPAPGASPLLASLPRALAAPLAALLPRAALHRPTYQYIRLFRRLATDAGVAISQLASVWDDTPDPGERARAAAALANAINADAITALAHEIRPVLEKTNDPVAARRNLLERIEQVVVDDAALRHPVVRGEFERVLAIEMAAGSGPSRRLESAGAADGDAEVELAHGVNANADADDHGETLTTDSPPRRTLATAAQRRRGESPAPPSPLGPNHPHHRNASPRASPRASPKPSPSPKAPSSPSHTAALFAHSRTDSADTIDTISHADLIAIGQAMPLPPSPPVTPAPESLGQVVMSGARSGGSNAGGVDAGPPRASVGGTGPDTAVETITPGPTPEPTPDATIGTPEPPRRRSARLSRTPAK